jgi:N utilization substance protein B
MYTRHEVRKFAMQILYMIDQNEVAREENRLQQLRLAREAAKEEKRVFIESDVEIKEEVERLTLASAVEQVFDNFEKSDDAIGLANYVTLNIERINNLIAKSLTNYTLDRLNSVDKAILRLATGEMLQNVTPREVVINEALELTREFSDSGDNRAVRFDNKVLDNIKNNL